MPGLVNVHFNDDVLLLQYIQGLSSHTGNVREFVCQNLEEASVPCYHQQWASLVAIKNITAHNSYAVVRAHRSTGVESMLIIVDVEDHDSVALAMAFAVYARRQVYWARDIFFVFVEHGAMGLDAFLSSYHYVRGFGLQGEGLHVNGGAIIGGLVVKTHAHRPLNNPIITIELNQINGQLPNLDLFNSLVRISSRKSPIMEPIIYNIHNILQEVEKNPLLIPLRAMYTQAFIAIEGTHSVMSKFGVQGLTIGVPSRRLYSLKESTLFVEASVRTLNNILERFHQSYFMYILTSEVNFLSIAYFMPAMAVLLPLVLLAYKEWTEMVVFRVPLSFVLLHIPGLVVTLAIRIYFAKTVATETSVLALMGILLIPFGLISPLHPLTYSCMRFLLYLETALLCVSISLINFSLALACSVVITPLMIVFTRSVTENRKVLVRTAVNLISHPILVIMAVMTVIRPLLLLPEIELDYSTVISTFQQMLSEYMVFGSWSLPLLTFVGTFIWNASLCLASCKSEEYLLASSENTAEATTETQ
ncbi:unnamed protein product [Auanema sp. JU1783]|nr:unnamed protein product [Auanema sp. JU1783]